MARTYKDSPRRFTCANLREGSKWFFDGEWWWCNNRNSKKRHNRALRRKRKQETRTVIMDEFARDQYEEMLEERAMWEEYGVDIFYAEDDYYNDSYDFYDEPEPEPEPEDDYDEADDWYDPEWDYLDANCPYYV